MTTKQAIAISFALLLSLGVRGQQHEHSMPGMQMPSQQKQEPQQANQPDPPGAPGMQTPQGALPTIEQQQQYMQQHEMQMNNMEMRTPASTPSQISGLQEPENPDQKTGENLPVDDLLAGAQKSTAKKLEEFEQLALKANPTLKQANVIARQSSALARQAGLWPNPSVGYQGEQIQGGSYRGGEQGGFVQQSVVLGGKLGRRKQVFEQQQKADELGIEEQRLDVLGAVRLQFYSALAAQRTVDVRQRLLQIAMDAASTAHQLANVGQGDAPDILQTEVEAEQAKLDFIRAQRQYIQAFRMLAAVSGSPDLAITYLEGDIDHPPEIDVDHWVDEAIAQSPGIKRVEQEVSRAEAVLARDKHEAIPDLSLRAGIQQNREIDPESMRPVGVQGFASASIQIPIFNRNQGNVEAAQLELERSKQEVDRTKLALRRDAQPLLQRYALERLEVERYRTQLIPRAQRAYELYLQKYRNMAAAYPEVIISQRTLFQLQESYTRALGDLWSSAIQLQNYLFAQGLSTPRSTGSTSTQVNPPNVATGGNE